VTVNPDATDCPSRRWPTLLQLERYADTHLATTDGTVSHGLTIWYTVTESPDGQVVIVVQYVKADT
jgi:hypothetical protein